MNYIDRIANDIQENIPSSLMPRGDTSVLFRMYAVLALAKGEKVSLEDVHNAWAAWRISSDPNAESLVPFGDLDPSIQIEDQPFVLAIRETAMKFGH